MMDAIVMIILTLQITTIISKKHRERSSSESIENLLYYQDCKHKKKDTPAPVQMLRAPPPAPTPPACPCPKMCCSMCCECTTPMSFVQRQMEMPMPPQSPMQPMQPSPPKQPPFQLPVQPQLAQRKRKKVNPMTQSELESMMQPPIGGRRDLGFTRENIKNLIAQDSDLKMILKDLVRVTMKKVDLFEMAKAGKVLNSPELTTEPSNSKAEEDDDDEN